MLAGPAQSSHHRRKSQQKEGVELRQDRTQEAVTEIFNFLMGLSVLCVAPKGKPGSMDRSHKETDFGSI